MITDPQNAIDKITKWTFNPMRTMTPQNDEFKDIIIFFSGRHIIDENQQYHVVQTSFNENKAEFLHFSQLEQKDIFFKSGKVQRETLKSAKK